MKDESESFKWLENYDKWVPTYIIESKVRHLLLYYIPIFYL